MSDFQSWDLLALFVVSLLGAAVTFFGWKREAPAPAPQPGPSSVQQAADKEMANEVQKAQEEHEKKVVEATKAHDAELSAQVLELEAKTDKIKDDPESVTLNLLDIGKKIRE